MQDKLTEALKTHTVDYADIRIEDLENSWVTFQGPELDSIGSSRTLGGIVRALYRGGWGYATFNDLDQLEARERGCEIARLVGKEKTQLAPVTPVDMVSGIAERLRLVPLARKL
jgi:TldD protein